MGSVLQLDEMLSGAQWIDGALELGIDSISARQF